MCALNLLLPPKPNKLSKLYGDKQQLQRTCTFPTIWHWIEGYMPRCSWIVNNDKCVPAFLQTCMRRHWNTYKSSLVDDPGSECVGDVLQGELLDPRCCPWPLPHCRHNPFGCVEQKCHVVPAQLTAHGIPHRAVETLVCFLYSLLGDFFKRFIKLNMSRKFLN